MASHAEAPPASPPASGSKHPKQLGKYVLERVLGAGGMGTVYLAKDTELNRTVALKVLPSDRADNPTLVKRFKSEGQTAARLEHDNIVKVFEAGQIKGQLYLALEYIDGIDVLELTRKRDVLPVRRSIEIIRQVAEALQHAADRKMVHRDIKPSNILIRKDGVVKLADMGLARAIDDTVDTNITRDGMTVGTVDYMSPEQARDSKAADIRSDLYSLGCSWYHMLTGKPPYPDGSVTNKLQAHATKPPPDPRHLNDRVPEAVVAVIQRLMAKRPIDRYQTPADLVADLKQAHLGRTGVQADLLRGLAEEHTEADAPAEQQSAPEEQPTQRTKRKRDKPRSQDGQPTKSANRSSSPAAPRVRGTKKRKASSSSAPEQGALPQKASNPEALGGSQKRIDPELIKLGFYGLLALTFVGIIGWVIMGLTDFDDGPSGTGSSPFVSRNPDGQAQPPTPPSPVNPVNPAPPDEQPQTPDVSTTDVRDFERKTPFPGAGLAPGAHDVPDWVYEARSRPLSELQTFTINADTARSGELAQVLSSMAPQGGIIEFDGSIPFEIDVAEIAERERVVLRGADGTQPVLLLRQPIRLVRGQFKFQGVHIVVPSREFNGGAKLIQVESATLLFRESSLTVTDPSPVPLKAIQLSNAGGPSRCILEHALIRGNNLTAVASEGPSNEIVAGNCLLAGGNAPNISVASPSAEDSATAGTVDPTVNVEILASVLTTSSSSFAFSQSPDRAAPRIRLWTGNVLFVADGTSSLPWMHLRLWPEIRQGDTENPRASGMDWTSRDSHWIGWQSFVRMQPPAGPDVTVSNETEWVQFWRRPIDTGAFLESPGEPLTEDHSRIDAVGFQERFDALIGGVATTAIAVPVETGALPEVPQNIVERITAVTGRPHLPPGFADGTARNVVQFDLDKGRTLNRFLNSEQCPDHSRVVLFGSGRKLIEPVQLKNKSLRLEFQSREKPLFVEPLPSSDERPEAVFSVEGGRLDLVGARIRIPASATRNYPLRILKLAGADFSIQNCQFQGQLRDGATDSPLIEWTDPPAGQAALIADSFLIGRSALLAGDVSGRLAEIHNCILLSQYNALVLDSSAGTGDGYVVLQDCTISAGKSAFVVGDPGGGHRVHLFVDRTVFGPTLEPIEDGPFVVTLRSGENTSQSVSWWEHRNAYSAQFQTFLAFSDRSAEQQDFQQHWLGAWGHDHVLAPLTGSTAVLFDDPPDSTEKALVENFILRSSSGAAQWGPDGGPIGAHVARIGPDAEDLPERSPRNPGPKGPVRTNPGF